MGSLEPNVWRRWLLEVSDPTSGDAGYLGVSDPTSGDVGYVKVYEEMRMPDTFTIGLVQMRCAPDATANLAKAEAAIAEAAKKGAQIVCLPELFTGPYFCQREDVSLFDLAEPIPGPSSERLGAAARANDVIVGGSLFERRMAGVYHNTATVHDSTGHLLGLYRKM